MRTETICVMGGSFDPPTRAHLALMTAAVDALQADRGIFAPSSQAYVEKKRGKQKRMDPVLPEKVRQEMLAAMCAEDRRLQVDPLEFGSDGQGRTFDTMAAIQEAHPQAELWFIAGGDKLSVISRWHRSEEFLQRFHILAASRAGTAPEEAILANPLLCRYRERSRILPVPEDILDISSTQVRQLLREGDQAAAAMVHPAVWQMLLAEGRLKREIVSFRGRFDFLSNFYEAPILYGGIRYGSGEAAFQAQKCQTEAERLAFQDLRPGQAKKAGRKVPLRPDWEQVKVGLMLAIVRAKFTQNGELARKLLETGDRPIVEGNTWGDTCWGVDVRTGRGENHLGKILMQVREELRG